MSNDIVEVWYVEYRKGNRRVGWFDDEDNKITKNKSHITFFTTQDAAQDALNNFCAGDQDVVGKVKYQSISVKDFMEI